MINQLVDLINYLAQVRDGRLQNFTGSGDGITRKNDGYPRAFQAANRLKVHLNRDQLVEQRPKLLGANWTSRSATHLTFHNPTPETCILRAAGREGLEQTTLRETSVQHCPPRRGCLCVGALSEQHSD